jgi:hypothetical protein
MDRSLEGRTGKPFRVVVEEGKIREFAQATKSTNPAYRPVDGVPTVSPVTFLASAAFWATPESSPWAGAERNLARILHGEQEYVFTGRPPGPGAVLTAKSRIDRVYEKQGGRGGTMTFAELVTEFRDESGALVVESRATVIETGKAPQA